MAGKALANDYEGRIREVLSDPCNALIPRVDKAGKVIGNIQIMHNGLRVLVDGYYGPFITKMLLLNKGVHEPQEEYVFMNTLNYIKKGATIVELGSYWAFYSMWFKSKIANAKCFMVEPEANFIEIGKKNFLINGMNGDFTNEAIGNSGISIDDYAKRKKISYIDILHSDIQGKELEMLKGAKKLIANKKIGYIFIGTHSQNLHYDCMEFLTQNGYEIIASADFDNETFCYDGVIVARDGDMEGMEVVTLSSRSQVQ